MRFRLHCVYGCGACHQSGADTTREAALSTGMPKAARLRRSGCESSDHGAMCHWLRDSAGHARSLRVKAMACRVQLPREPPGRTLQKRDLPEALPHRTMTFEENSERCLSKRLGRPACMDGCINVWMHICTESGMHGIMHAWMHACTGACMAAWMRACMDACMHAFIHEET